MLYESLTGDLEYFYDELPADVRRDLSFMLVSLSDETIVDHEREHDYEAVAPMLFAAQTRIGRLSDLIRVAAIFDVYFAMDARRRFKGGNGARDGAPHAGRIDAIEAAARDWAHLRSTTLAPAAIAAALVTQSPQDDLPAGGRLTRAIYMRI
jgi:hypothetical protein